MGPPQPGVPEPWGGLGLVLGIVRIVTVELPIFFRLAFLAIGVRVGSGVRIELDAVIYCLLADRAERCGLRPCSGAVAVIAHFFTRPELASWWL